MTGLAQCPRCGWWTRQLGPTGQCGDCEWGWAHCPVHGRLEWDGHQHQRVTVRDVLDTLGGATPRRRMNPPSPKEHP